MTSAALNMLGPMAELGAFQRSRVRRTAAVIAAVVAVSLTLVLVSVVMNGVEITFDPETPVRLPILATIAMMLHTPIAWSAVFRSRRYGVTLTRDALVVVSWWRTRRFTRSDFAGAVSLPAVTRLRDGYFSGGGTDSAPRAVWLRPTTPGRSAFPLGVTTGSKGATVAAARRINAWLEVRNDADDESPASR